VDSWRTGVTRSTAVIEAALTSLATDQPQPAHWGVSVYWAHVQPAVDLRHHHHHHHTAAALAVVASPK